MNRRVCFLCKKRASLFRVKGLPLYHCKFCRVIFQSPLPKNEYTPNELNWGDRDPRVTEATHKMKRITFQILINEIKKFRPSGTLLDIGTGTGVLLEVANKSGFTSIGLEPDKNFSQEAQKKKLTVINSSLKKAEIPPASMDIVVLYDVIEHLQNPKSSLKKIGKFLRPKGLLIISTPNIDSLSFKILGKNWPHFKREHLYYFSRKSLSLLLKQCGFKVMDYKNSYKALNFNYINGYFNCFPTPIFSPLASFLNTILPSFLNKIPIIFPSGNILVIAQKTSDCHA